jgi:uncharacterized protein
MFVFAFMGFYGGVKRLHGKSLVSVVTGYERFRMKRFWFAYIIWGSLILITTVISYLMDPSQATVRFDPAGFAFSALIMIALMPIQTGLEEVFFRGYLVQGLALIFRNGIVPLFLSSLLFAFAHMSNPEVAEYGWTLMFTYYCCFALFMGMITLLDEGTELAWGIHFANNMVSGLLITSPHSVIKPYAILEAKKEDPSAEIVIWFVLAAITFTAMLLRYRWRNFKHIVR